MDVVDAASTNLFVGTDEEPRQVVRVVVRGSARAAGEAATASSAASLTIDGDRVRTEQPLTIGPLASGTQVRLEVPVVVANASPGETLVAEVRVTEHGDETATHRFEFVVAEPGWRMFMVSHFHYDPVWWNTQAAYTETWGTALQHRQPFQEPGLALVKAHLETARREPDYKFVLAELDYLKPYWAVYPEDREYIRELLSAGRLEFMGGTYNEPNSNLTSAESTIRNAIYGVAYQRDVLGGSPATAWQLDVFGHDPQFPGIMADAGVTSSSWARGPFHEWGPHWVRGAFRMPVAQLAAGVVPEMQFETEFDWISPSGRGVLTSFMADHYSSGWWMDAAATLEAAEEQVHFLFTDLAALAGTKNVLLPVGTDYSPPNKWLTEINRDWNARYVWPKFVPAIARDFFDAARAERTASGRRFIAQTRDMNPIYTGKDVSFIDTKQAQRAAENTLMAAEKFATFAALLGARVPVEAFDKAWRQLLFGAHHDGITGSESDQVYLDLLAGWREAQELAQAALTGALGHVASQIDTSGSGSAITVFNSLSWPRTDVVRVALGASHRGAITVLDDAGSSVPFLLEPAAERGDAAGGSIAFLARDVPAVGYRTFRLQEGGGAAARGAEWRRIDGTTIANEAYSVSVDPERGGGIVSLIDRRTGKELVQAGTAANELRAYSEYPNHPHFAEGPWHLTPDGRFASSLDERATVTVEESAIGRRIRVESRLGDVRHIQEITLWDGTERVDCSTRIDEFRGHDTLFRLRFPIDVEGGRPVSEVANAVVGRGFGFPDVDVAQVPFTLDNPAFNWFAIGSTARIELVDSEDGGAGTEDGAGGTEEGRVSARAGRAIGIAEVIAPKSASHDDAVRRLVVALVQAGVTSTTSRDDGPRYGILNIDSNLPDVRIAIGTPADNAFVAELLAAAGQSYANELDRQLASGGTAGVWIPAEARRAGAPPAFADLRGVRDLPVLVVAGVDEARTTAAVDALVDDLADAVIRVAQPATLDGSTGRAEDYTVAILNRGTPSFNIDEGRNLHLSVMRSCSGWPSGVWIDPPRRAVPDGSNFEFQHWSHTFEYAIVAGPGTWREVAIARAGHEFNEPLRVHVETSHDGPLPASSSFLSVDPPTVVATALKPAGNALARAAAPNANPSDGVVLRLYESAGRPVDARIRFAWPVDSAELTNLLEEDPRRVPSEGDSLAVHLGPFEIVTVRARLRVPEAAAGAEAAATAEPAAAGVQLAPRIEPAQPVFADYWMHNKGAAPMGNQPVTVGIRPWVVEGRGPFRVPVAVASERTDDAVAGKVVIDVPAGWSADPPERLYRLAPGAHLAFDATVTAPDDAEPGRYFVAARIEDDAGQVSEDILTVDIADEPLEAIRAATAAAPERASRGGEGAMPSIEGAAPAMAGGPTAVEGSAPDVEASTSAGGAPGSGAEGAGTTGGERTGAAGGERTAAARGERSADAPEPPISFPAADTSVRSRSLARAVERAVRRVGISDVANADLYATALGGELTAELTPPRLPVEVGGRAELTVTLASTARSEIRGEVQVISPHETWPAVTPWTQGFAVGPGGTTSVTIKVEPPLSLAGRTYWALVKVMYFGRLLYTDSVALEFTDGRGAG